MNNTEDIELRHQVLMVFQTALLGMVTPDLRGVSVNWSPTQIRGFFFYDGDVSEAEREIVSDVESEVIASFSKFAVDLEARSCPASKRLPSLEAGAWVYRRLEK